MRVTVKFSGALPAEQILGQAPLADRLRRAVAQLGRCRPESGRRCLAGFHGAGLVGRFRQARSAAAAPGAGAEDASRPQRALSAPGIAASPAFPHRAGSSTYATIPPQSARSRARSMRPRRAGQPAEEGRIHGLLATLYAQQVDRLSDSAADLYLQLAANEAQTGPERRA